MTNSGLVIDGPAVEWVCAGVGVVPGPHLTAIGYARDGVLIAGFAFEGWTINNIFAHARIDEPAPRGLWFAAVDYVFRQLNCIRMTAVTDDTNVRAKRMLEHAGFVRETELDSAAPDGSDRVVYVLWRDNCHMLGWGKEPPALH